VGEDRQAENRADAEKWLSMGREYRQRGDWKTALRHLENGVWSAASARSRDLLEDLIAELDAAAAVHERGSRRRMIDWILQEATRYRDQFAEEEQLTPGRDRLKPRLQSVLFLLLYGDDEVTAGDTALQSLAVVNGAGEVVVELNQEFTKWASLLRQGYDEGYETFAATSGPALRDARQQIERTVKNTAAELVTSGAEVRGLAVDAIPMIAFALLHSQIPMGADAATSPVSADRVNDSVLRIADNVAAMPGSARPLFIDLYRLALLLGFAQRYAEDLEITQLSLG